jgi:hypothetical protein
MNEEGRGWLVCVLICCWEADCVLLKRRKK